MTKRIKAYKNKIDELLAHPENIDDIEKLRAEHLIQISFFMHERLVHLLVTILFALMTIIILAIVVITCQIIFMILLLLLLVLLVPYVMHYYLLENSVQHMYEQYDMMSNAGIVLKQSDGKVYHETIETIDDTVK